MPQNVQILAVSREWDFLEPVQNPDYARTDHIKLAAAASGTFVTYPAGQLVRQKDDGTNEFAKQGTAGYTGPARLIKYPVTVNDAGAWARGSAFVAPAQGGEVFEGTMGAYYRGYFKTTDITGLTDDDVMNDVGYLTRGTRAAGILHLGGGRGPAPV
jgi:hypothetical protein